METVIPFDATTPKTRLGDVLDPDERNTVSRVLLQDVLDAVTNAGLDPTVIATEPIEVDAALRIDHRPLTPLISDEIDAHTPLVVIMADLGLLQSQQVSKLVDTAGDVVLAPGLGGGTNALVVRNEDFEVDFHGTSFRDHCTIANSRGLSVATVDSFRLGVDVDEPQDLLEVLLHSSGRTAAWLTEAGFEIEATNGRPSIRR